MSTCERLLRQPGPDDPNIDLCLKLTLNVRVAGKGDCPTCPEHYREAELPQLQGKVYCDHAGATLYTASQLRAVMQVTVCCWCWLLQMPCQHSKHSRGSGELPIVAIMVLGARKLAEVALWLLRCVSWLTGMAVHVSITSVVDKHPHLTADSSGHVRLPKTGYLMWSSSPATLGSRPWQLYTPCAAGNSCTHQASPFLCRTCRAMCMGIPTACRAGLPWRGLRRLWQRPGASPWRCAMPLRQPMSASSPRAPQVCASLPRRVYVSLRKRQSV